MGRKFIDLTGLKFNKLIIKNLFDKDKNGNYRYLCLCDCGKETVIIGSKVKNGYTKSCGCLHIKHGHSINGKRSTEYTRWQTINQRCNNPNDPAYKNYGKRKIKVCYRWSNKNPRGFENFFKDIGKIPKDMEIDRINNNLGYSPKNFRLVTRKENCKNKRTNRLIPFNDKNYCITELEKITGINRGTISNRLKNNWSIEDALTIPTRKYTNNE